MKMDVLASAPPPHQCPQLPANWAIPANEPRIIRDQQASNARTYPL
ncbi:hypothetical protein KRR40_38070 [Niabella defluvii]|nr:hypothetical protein KRR40_38070 [Niabella sp. I65]